MRYKISNGMEIWKQIKNGKIIYSKTRYPDGVEYWFEYDENEKIIRYAESKISAS